MIFQVTLGQAFLKSTLVFPVSFKSQLRLFVVHRLDKNIIHF